MSELGADHQELIDLAEDQCHGLLTEEKIARLESLLAGDETAQQLYLDTVLLHGDLACARELPSSTSRRVSHADTVSDLGSDTVSAPLRFERVTKWCRSLSSAYVVAAILLVVFGYVGWILWPTDQQAPQVPNPAGFSLAYYNDEGEAPQYMATTCDESDLARLGTGVAISRGERLLPGTFALGEGHAGIEFRGGANVELDGQTVFGLESEQRATLFSGALRAKNSDPNAIFTIDTRSVRLVDYGTEFTVSINDVGETEVHVIDGEVEAQTRLRLPISFWNFDTVGVASDCVTSERAKLGKGVNRVAGLVGNGALQFDNGPDAYVDVGNGGGTKVGTGRYSVSTGITIEAVIQPAWRPNGFSLGKPAAYDEIFRKEDGIYRLLFSFQDDRGIYQFPKGTNGPCLAFGLHLVGHGYSELEVMLDGHDRRPTLEQLRDGRPHHVVATYDSWSGVKAIYIDGQVLAQYRFPRNTPILSGGKAGATIGNISENKTRPVRGREAFKGVIDEVAFYDFPLSAEEIAAHYANVQKGKNYFGFQDTKPLQDTGWKRVARLVAGQRARFDADTGLPSDEL